MLETLLLSELPRIRTFTSYPQPWGRYRCYQSLISGCRERPQARVVRDQVLSEEVELPPQLQEQLLRLQQLQQTLQAVASQKQQLEIEASETEKALAELEKLSDETPVYKSVGNLLLKSERQSLLKELKERKDLLGTRITVLGRQEERTKERLKELQGKLQERLRPQGPAAS